MKYWGGGVVVVDAYSYEVVITIESYQSVGVCPGCFHYNLWAKFNGNHHTLNNQTLYTS